MGPMMNMYDEIRANLHSNKFVVGELLFVEYKCPIEQEEAGVWTPMDYFVHVLSGTKTWRTTDGTWTLEKGQTLFVKKGAAVLYQDFKDDVCVVFFVSDSFIRDVVREVSRQLSAYFQSLLKSDAPPLSQIMEANFCCNLALEKFARLSHRSLSTFKRDFRRYYNQSPGKWLLHKRLEYSAVLLKNPGRNVSQVALDCGFEDLSHFSRAFKDKFGISPASYRK